MDLGWSLSDKGENPKVGSGSGSDDMSKQNEIVPLTLGILSDPPTLVLIYESSEVGKLKKKKRKRRIPLRNFNVRSDVAKTVFGIQTRHSEYLQSVPSITLEKMVYIIQEVQNGISVDEAVVKVQQKYNISPDEDLNKVSAAELSRKKEIMNESFQKSLIKPNDPEFVYDKQVDFEKSVDQKKENVWDEEDEDDDEQDIDVLVLNSTRDERIESASVQPEKLPVAEMDLNNRQDLSDSDDSDKSDSDNEVSDNNSGRGATAEEVVKPTEIKIDPESMKPVNSIYDEFDLIPDENFW